MDPFLKIRVETPDPKTVLLRCEGEFAGMDVLGKESEIVGGVERAGGGNVVFDFSNVTYIDSAGVGIIYKCVKKAKERGLAISVYGAADDIKKIMTAAALHKLIQFL